jgi:hypothetical protein
VLSDVRHGSVTGIEDVLAADRVARERAQRWLESMSASPARHAMGT